MDQTAKLCNLPLSVVENVINYQFEYTKQNMVNPTNPVTLHLEHFGKIRPLLNSLNQQIITLLPLLRNDRSLIPKFQYAWKLRQYAIKEKFHRNYKKRLGKWHHTNTSPSSETESSSN